MEDVVMKEMAALAAEKQAEAERPADLVAENLVKIYGDRTVVYGMSMEVRCAEIVGLLGPNGAG